MRPSEALSLHRSQIREIALRHRVSGVRVFGSALHGDDSTEVEAASRHGRGCAHPQQPARQLPGSGDERGLGRLSRAHPLRVADYFQNDLLLIQKQVSTLQN
jgi:hypothetical protein